jgi:mono/diheme cytochrome c family protein
MSKRSLAFLVFVLGLNWGFSATVGEPPVPPHPTISSAGVRTNRTQNFAPPRASLPLLPPTLFYPPAQPQNARAGVPVGIPAPLANPGPITPQTRPAPTATASPFPTAPTQPPSYIAYDAEMKEYHAKVGDSMAHFTFYLTNVSKEVVSVNSVHTSCGCTVAQLPEQPWKLAPGTNGPINVTVNLAGKSGTVVKSVTVDTTAGVKSLLVKVHIPTPAGGQQFATPGNIDVNRMQNMQMAQADRQAVFKGECAKCHAEPTKGLAGSPLYDKACGICHDAEHRASSVPDLKHLNHPTNPDHWRTWITSGKVGSMMPGFAKALGGPLEDAQIESLVKYLSITIPSKPAGTPTAAATRLNPPAPVAKGSSSSAGFQKFQ